MTLPQKGKKGFAAAAAIVVALGSLTVVRAQIQYQTGQNVAPVYEGWMPPCMQTSVAPRATASATFPRMVSSE